MTILDLSIVTHSFKYDRIPSGKLTVENGHLLRWFTHQKWWFSIVLLYVCQKGNHNYGDIITIRTIT